MHDRPVIFGGLALFLVLATLPLWRNAAAPASTQGPRVVLPAGQKQCVAPTAYMRASHMQLLLDWRDTVVRRNGREYTSPDGRRFAISLTNTCLGQCHGARAEFCDRCHNYAAVSLPCWDCHLDSKSVVRAGL